MDQILGQKLIELREKIASNFDAENWEEIGLLTGFSDLINGHARLLRSLSWSDEDYSGNVLTVLRQIIERQPNAINIIETYLNGKFPEDSHYISAKPSMKKITFAPNVFQIPEGSVEIDLVAVMMPFSVEFEPVYGAIKKTCKDNDLRCLRADDIWEESTIIQDIFNLIFRAKVVIADFSNKNPNVMYEIGIAHTLGKHVIPITQSLTDLPFDLQHHRALKYLPNTEGISTFSRELSKKLKQFSTDKEQIIFKKYGEAGDVAY